MWGQTFTGTISGVVNDPNSARIPHATIHSRNEANGEVRQVTTGNDGLFVFSQLPPGTYELSAEVQGFRKAVQTGVVLRVNQTLEVNFALQLGAVSEVVEVSGGVHVLAGAGHINLIEDTTGKGHITRNFGPEDRVVLTIPLADGVVIEGTRKPRTR